MNKSLKKCKTLLPFLLLFSGFAIGQKQAPATRSVVWGQTITLPGDITKTATLSAANATKANINALSEIADTSYGSQYCRLLDLKNRKWLAVYTVRTNEGYQKDPEGGLRLEIARSTDNGQNWTVIARLKDRGRDLDNGQLVLLKNGHILLSSRSVRWQASYRLPVYESDDQGRSWKFLSSIDSNEGSEGSLGHPDKGVYEPHFTLLANGRLAVFYANEKHVTEAHSYSQVISEKISSDNGKSWGKEIFVASNPQNKDARPGMPVCTQMKNGKFIIVYEVCGTQDCNIYQKTSSDGVHWATGIGTPIAEQSGAPFIMSMSGGALVVTSNRGNISVSDNYGQSWKLLERPWNFAKTYEEDWHQALWPSLYQFDNGSIAVTAARKRPDGQKGYDVRIRFGQLR